MRRGCDLLTALGLSQSSQDFAAIDEMLETGVADRMETANRQSTHFILKSREIRIVAGVSYHRAHHWSARGSMIDGTRCGRCS